MAQIVKVTRHRRCDLRATVEVVFYITSLARGAASAAQLLRWIRGHWAIENRLHYIRDVTFGEDASRVRKGHGPDNLALFRNLSIGLCLRRARARAGPRVYLPTILRAHQAEPTVALALVHPAASARLTASAPSLDTT